MDLKAAIDKLERKMCDRELSDDGYYISRQYKEDCFILAQLKKQLKQNADK